MAILLGSPANRQHPLNRGRAGWWMVLPGGPRGYQFRDLMGRNHGTLTAVPTWQSGFLGGWGSLRIVAASSQYVDFGTGSLPAGGDLTLAATVKLGSGETGSILSFSNSGSPTKLIDLSIKSSDGQARFQLYDGTNNPFTDGGGDLTAATHRITATRTTGGLLSLYVDGVLANSTADTAASSLSDGSQIWTAGNRRDMSGGFFTGYVDNLVIASRAWSADEVKQDYRLSRMAYPGVLNRTKTPPWWAVSVPAGGGATTTKFLTLLGVG